MSSKNMIYISTLAGSTIGGFIPLLWGGSTFSFSSLVLSAVCGLLALYVSYKVFNG